MSAERWAIVEIMGHRVRAGRVSEITQFGVVMCRIEVPTPDGEGFEPAEDYGGAAIFAIQNSTKDKVLERARAYTPPAMQLTRGDDDPDFVSCADCGVALVEDATYEGTDKQVRCRDCHEDKHNLTTCEQCNALIPIDNHKQDSAGNHFCEKCFNDPYTFAELCTKCGSSTPANELRRCKDPTGEDVTTEIKTEDDAFVTRAFCSTCTSSTTAADRARIMAEPPF